MQYKNYQYLSNHISKTISEAILGSNGFVFNDKELSYPFNIQKLKNINTLWDESKFSDINLPLSIFELSDFEKEKFSQPIDMRVLDMPIKFPGSDYKIPFEIIDFLPIIQKAAFHEKQINLNLEQYYCYITIDRRIVKKDNHTRKAGIHVDGFQGARIESKLPVDHSYIIYDNSPTIFYNQAFEVKPYWNKSCHNYFEGFQQQITPNTEITMPNYQLLLIDAYCLHEAPIVTEDIYRTFCRLSFTVREFDRLGNAHNPMFYYNWEMLPRDTQATLECPI